MKRRNQNMEILKLYKRKHALTCGVAFMLLLLCLSGSVVKVQADTFARPENVCEEAPFAADVTEPDASYAPGTVLIFVRMSESRKHTAFTPDMFPEAEISELEYVCPLFYDDPTLITPCVEYFYQQFLRATLADADADVTEAAARLEANPFVDTAMPEYSFFTKGRPAENAENETIQITEDWDNGIVYIDGTGALPSYFPFAGKASPLNLNMNTFVIGEGITYIGDYVFSDLLPVRDEVVDGYMNINVILPDSLQGISPNAFGDAYSDNMRLYVKTDPVSGEYVYEDIPLRLTIYAPEGSAAQTYVEKLDAEGAPKMQFVNRSLLSAPKMYGDLDKDEALSAADALLVLKKVVKLEVLSLDRQLAADVDGDGEVTAEDALWILKKVVHLTAYMPAEL